MAQKIEPAGEPADIQPFCGWLNRLGYEATPSGEDGARVDGVSVEGRPELALLITQLWNDYCLDSVRPDPLGYQRKSSA